MIPHPAHRGGRAKSSAQRTQVLNASTTISRLSLATGHRTSAPMPAELFDMNLRALRRDRAFRCGGELFLLERIFEDCLDRLGLLQQTFASALLIGCPDPSWPQRLRNFARDVLVLDPGPSFAQAARGSCVMEDELHPTAERHDLCVAVGTLDTVNDLPQALSRICAS